MHSKCVQNLKSNNFGGIFTYKRMAATIFVNLSALGISISIGVNMSCDVVQLMHKFRKILSAANLIGDNNSTSTFKMSPDLNPLI